MMAKKKKCSKKKKTEHYRTGQYVKPKSTGKVTTNLSQKDWEKVPGTGTSPINPPKYKMKEEARAKQQSKFDVKKAKEREKPTQVAVESLYEAAGEGAPYARLTAAVRRGAKGKRPVSAGDRRGPHFRDPVTGKVPDYDELWSLRTGEGAAKETDAQRTARLKREQAKKAKYEAEHRKPYTLEEIGKEGFKNRAMKEEYERGLKREQFLKGVTTPPSKPRNVLKEIIDPDVLPALSEPTAMSKKGGSIKRKTGGALGTGAALRGYGKGYKKGGTI